MPENNSWEPDWYKEEDKTDILALNKIEYGDTALAQESYFDWIYAKNPLGSPILPVAREKGTGRVVGFLMQVPVRISWGGENYPVLIGFNILISKEYRRQGVSTVIYQLALDEAKRRGYHLFMTFPNPRSLALHVKLQDIIVSKIPLVIRPLDIHRLAQDRISNPILQWPIRAGWIVAGNTIWRERTLAKISLPVSIVEDKEFDDSYDCFWEKIKAKYGLMLVRDRAFLQWRFIDIPHRSYQILSARQGSDILGYIVLRIADIRGTRCGLISDFLVIPGERGDQIGLHLLHQAAQRFRQEKLALEGGLFMPKTQEYSILRRAGYIPSPDRYAPQQFHLIVNNLSLRLPSDALAMPDAWFISLADHDAV